MHPAGEALFAMDDAEFTDLVEAAIEQIPPQLYAKLTNVAIVIEDSHPESLNILGLYQGVALTDRTSSYGFVLPDKISIYKYSLCRICSSREELTQQVKVTVIHEIAHHFGIDDARLHELGWG